MLLRVRGPWWEHGRGGPSVCCRIWTPQLTSAGTSDTSTSLKFSVPCFHLKEISDKNIPCLPLWRGGEAALCARSADTVLSVRGVNTATCSSDRPAPRMMSLCGVCVRVRACWRYSCVSPLEGECPGALGAGGLCRAWGDLTATCLHPSWGEGVQSVMGGVTVSESLGGVYENYQLLSPSPEPLNLTLGISSHPCLAFSLWSQAETAGLRTRCRHGSLRVLLIPSKRRTLWGGERGRTANMEPLLDLYPGFMKLGRLRSFLWDCVIHTLFAPNRAAS